MYNTHEPSRGLPLGWLKAVSHSRAPIGFNARTSPPGRTSRLITHESDGHLLAVASTGAGKGRGGVIPALLTHPGATLTIDIKAENLAVAGRYRKSLGHRVVVIDPFGIADLSRLGLTADTLNPLDLIALPGGEAGSDSETLADCLTGGQPAIAKDMFWDNNAKGLLTGVIGLTAESADAGNRNLGQVLDYLYASDADYDLAVILDTHKFRNELARQELVAYLAHEGDKVRPSVRSTAQSMVKSLGSRPVRQAVARTTFDLGQWVRGENIDVFLVFPPDKLDSHRALLRLILGTLLSLLFRRRNMPTYRTLLLLDECAQLGTLQQLKTALTLMRGYAVQVYSFWQDLSQLKHLYKADWETIINNSAVIQAFGLTNGWVARTLADVLQLPADDLIAMDRRDLALLWPGHNGTQIVRRVDYLIDSIFAGRFDPNPRYGHGARPRSW